MFDIEDKMSHLKETHSKLAIPMIFEISKTLLRMVSTHTKNQFLSLDSGIMHDGALWAIHSLQIKPTLSHEMKVPYICTIF